ncbi:hypothetical protein [Streptomyces coelicoflavus]
MLRSFYDLNFGIHPGGTEKDVHYVRRTLEEVKHDLSVELLDQRNIYLLCYYGAWLNLDVYQNGKRTESIDLHPFLEISIEGCPPITFSGPQQPVDHSFDLDEESEDDSSELSHRMWHRRLGHRVGITVHWDSINVPPLRRRTVSEGDSVALYRRPCPASYGYQDFRG